MKNPTPLPKREPNHPSPYFGAREADQYLDDLPEFECVGCSNRVHRRFSQCNECRSDSR